MPKGKDTGAAFTFNWPTDEFLAEVRVRAERGFAKAAAFVQGEIKRTISAKQVLSKSARADAARRGESLDPNVFRGSKPGEPPAIRTGNLRNSIQTARLPDGTARVGSTAKYGLWLEFGTAKMLPRPFIVPTMLKNKRNIERIIRKEIAGGD